MKKVCLLAVLLLLAVAPFAQSSCSTLDITDEQIGPFHVGVAANEQVNACCGTAPYTFSIYSGSLPAGLSMSSSGLITGTPTTSGESFVCIQVTDAAGCQLTKCFFVETF